MFFQTTNQMLDIESHQDGVSGTLKLPRQLEGMGDIDNFKLDMEWMEDMDADAYARKLGYNTQEMLYKDRGGLFRNFWEGRGYWSQNYAHKTLLNVAGKVGVKLGN